VVRPLSNVIGIDDAPHAGRARVPLIGAVFAKTRLDGVLIDHVQRDGRDSTRRIAAMVLGSRFRGHVQAVVLQGIAVAGFNVIDIHALHAELGVPVLVVARRRPNLPRIRRVLLEHVPGGARKWALIERAGTPRLVGGVYVQCAGLDARQAERMLRELTVHGSLPEPVRVAHLIAGAVVTGHSKGRA
jgi:endonuclease V-like protein UPF0215 family